MISQFLKLCVQYVCEIYLQQKTNILIAHDIKYNAEPNLNEVQVSWLIFLTKLHAILSAHVIYRISSF